MKEATGELSTTVITVVAIAAILSLFTVFLYPSLKGAILARVHCSEAVLCEGEGQQRKCRFYNEDGVNLNPTVITCPEQDEK
ncbi:MAG: hypothetical protein PUH53_01080 [Mycoplasma sp.]|nr:hypothetical protein [Mycoplasma sp.]MDY4545032.1 hypothetical protein [Bacilli bacterium]